MIVFETVASIELWGLFFLEASECKNQYQQRFQEPSRTIVIFYCKSKYILITMVLKRELA